MGRLAANLENVGEKDFSYGQHEVSDALIAFHEDIYLQNFRTYVANHPNYTLHEISQAWGHQNYQVTYFLLKTIGWYQKKTVIKNKEQMDGVQE